MPLVATFRQPDWSIVLPELEIARDELAPPGVEFLETPQLAEPHRGRDVRQVRFAPGNERVKTVNPRLDLSVPALELDRPELIRRAARDRPSLDCRHVLVGMEAEADQVAEAADATPAPG